MKKAAITFILSLGLAGCLTEQQFLTEKYQSGKQNFIQHHYRKAFEDLMPVAKAGNPDAQYAIGYIYYYGKGMLENHHEARYWMTLAARQGNVPAQRALKLLNNKNKK